jgi:hypothetical protein
VNQRSSGLLVCALAAAFLLQATPPSKASVAIENRARAAGVKIEGCLDCHASPHAREEMARRAKVAGFDPRNCQGCHGSKLAAKLGDRSNLSDQGQWLLDQRERRGAKAVDGAWLREYVHPTPQPGKP